MNKDIEISNVFLNRDHGPLTTRDLIAMLSAEDPEGNLPVVLEGQPLGAVTAMPYYYDGTPLLRDSPNSFAFMTGGLKLNLTAYNWRDAMWDNPNLVLHKSRERYVSPFDDGLQMYWEERKEMLTQLIQCEEGNVEEVLKQFNESNRSKMREMHLRNPDLPLLEVLLRVIEEQDT